MTLSFRDYFSKQADAYARYRPTYPPALYAYLASIAPERKLAWDVGTGNGQAAVDLAAHFDHVLATDASADQVAHANPHPRVEYRVESAEDVSLPDHGTDLITGALSIHWFDLDRFYRQARRVLQPGGMLAAWTYHAPVIESAVDHLVDRYYRLVFDYFPDRFHFVAERYATLPFPFKELKPPQFEMSAEWDYGQLIGFMESWSATRRYAEIKGVNPIDLVRAELAGAWGEPELKRMARWAIWLRIGSVDG